MTPTEAIATLPELQQRLTQLRDRLDREIIQVNRQWQQLGQLGAQRDDHAAALLATLRPHLTELARFATACGIQIDRQVAHPFAPEEAK